MVPCLLPSSSLLSPRLTPLDISPLHPLTRLSPKACFHFGLRSLSVLMAFSGSAPCGLWTVIQNTESYKGYSGHRGSGDVEWRRADALEEADIVR